MGVNSMVSAVLRDDDEAVNRLLDEAGQAGGGDGLYELHVGLAQAILQWVGVPGGAFAGFAIVEVGRDGVERQVNPDQVSDPDLRCMVEAGRFVAAVAAQDTGTARDLFDIYLASKGNSLTAGLCNMLSSAAAGVSASNVAAALGEQP
jgi:hypothetical protein